MSVKKDEYLFEAVLEIEGFGKKTVSVWGEDETNARQVVYAMLFNQMGVTKDQIEIKSFVFKESLCDD